MQWGALATQGAFATVYANDEPYRRRLRILVGVGLGLALAMTIGTLLTPVSPWAAALGSGLLTAGAALVMLAFEVGPPREYMLVLTYLVATGLPADAADAPRRAGLVLLGAAVVTAISMSGRLTRPRGPEEDAVGDAYERVTDLVTALGTPDVDERSHGAVLAVRRARLAMASAGAGDALRERLTQMTVAVESVLDATLELAAAGVEPVNPGWPQALRTVTAGVRETRAAAGVVLPEALPPGRIGRRLADAVEGACLAADPERLFGATIVPFLRRRPGRGFAALRRALRPSSLVVPTAGRAGVAVAAGTSLGLAIGDTRGYWVGLTASVVLQASNVQLAAWRTVHRAAGTIVGVGLAAAILTTHPAIGTIVVVIALCQILTQATVTGAYGVAVVFLTPIALLIFDLARPGAPISLLAGQRIIDTLLGCAVGLGARRLLWPQTAATRLPSAQGAAIEAVRNTLHAALTRPSAPDGVRLRRTRRALQTALMNLRAVQADASGDLLWSTRTSDGRWGVTLVVQRLAYATMAFPAERSGAADRTVVEHADAALGTLAAIADGHRLPALVPVPTIEGHPVLQRELVALRDELRGTGSGSD